DGRTLWASPTMGDAIKLTAGCDNAAAILIARPRAMRRSIEGQRLWRACGLAASGVNGAETVTWAVLPAVDYGKPEIFRRTDAAPSPDPPLLQREMELLLETTDDDRHLTLVANPQRLLADAGAILPSAVRDALLWALPEQWRAVSVSLHVDAGDRLYWEVRALGRAAAPAKRIARTLRSRADSAGSMLAEPVAARDWSAYSRALVERLPAMLRVAGSYARDGVEGRQAVANGYLPPGAGHQIALSARLLIAEASTPRAPTTAVAVEATLDDAGVRRRLARTVEVRFRSEPLETAVRVVADAAGVPVEVVGRDLQLDGITRNQMVTLDVAGVSAADALVTLLRQANPDPLAESVADPRQRLVYTINGGAIRITTRSAAADRGDNLPEAFAP
ncbi:MAG: hypothetical protein AAF805_13030, partial [Planctomycetota bacterium]